MLSVGKIQLGKNGVTDNFIQTLKEHFKKYRNIKISVMKSAGRNKEKVQEYSDLILNKLGNNFSARNIGFTIVLKKWRKPVR
jgi:RNA-binding protein YhbY